MDENPVRVYTQLSVLHSTCLLQKRASANNLFLQLKINTAAFRKTPRKGFLFWGGFLFFFLLGNMGGKCPGLEGAGLVGAIPTAALCGPRDQPSVVTHHCQKP